MSNLNFNMVIESGHLTADPKLAVTPGGQSVVNFTIAVTQGRGESAVTNFIPCEAWGNTAANIPFLSVPIILSLPIP